MLKESTIHDKVYLLCDCNNFFVSCEKLFRPDLKNRPVAVLSNNDGVIISRSYKTKALNIAMGTPVFKIQKEIAIHKITTFSSNFSLYLDISNRVMNTLEEFCKDIEVYLVDEAFLCFENIDEKTAIEYAYRLKNTIATKIGIPIGVGIAKTKPLAKLANHFAKKNQKITGGVYSILNNAKRQKLLIDNPIEEIWGVGNKMREHLTEDGFVSAFDLSKANVSLMTKKDSIVLAKTIKELNNVDCIEINSNPKDQNQIMWSRTFKDRIKTFDDLYEAISNYVADACAKLRSLDRYAQKITVFIRTSYFGSQAKYSNAATIELDFPCADTRIFMYVAKILLTHIYKEGYEYMKAGIILFNFVENRSYQADLFSYVPDKKELDKSDKLMNALDSINKVEKKRFILVPKISLQKKKGFIIHNISPLAILTFGMSYQRCFNAKK